MKQIVEYKRMSMRVMETIENLNSFREFLKKLEEIGLINIITESDDYPNRQSSMARNYYTIEFLDKEEQE